MVDLCPVAETHPPQVVGEHHATVEHVDHHPLVGSPKQGAGAASLVWRRRDSDEQMMIIKTFIIFGAAILI